MRDMRRFQFRMVDLLLATVVVALAVIGAIEDPLRGTAHSPILLVLPAGILGAITGRLVSGAFRFGFVSGLLLGVVGYILAVFALSLGIRIVDQRLFLVCVSAGGVIGGLIPLTLHRWRQTSLRSRLGILLVSFTLLVILTLRWWTVSEQARLVANLQAAGAVVQYSDVNPLPRMFDSGRLQSRSEWLRNLLGLRVVTKVTLRPRSDTAPVNSWSTNALMLHVETLAIHADHMNDAAFEILNSGKLSKLQTLRFAGREFDDASLARLDPLPNVVILDLDNTSVTDESIEHITRFPGLMILSVRKTDITAEGVKRLQSKVGRVVSSH